MSIVTDFRRPASRTTRVGVRTALARSISVLAVLLVWFSLVAPNDIGRLGPGAFLRIPVEGILLTAVVLLLPARTGRIVAVAAGASLGVLTVIRILDLGFRAALDRPFDPVTDWSYLGPALGVLRDSIGGVGVVVSVVGAALVLGGILVALPLSVLRLTRVARRNRRRAVRYVAALGVWWILGAAFDLQIVPDSPLAATETAGLAYEQVSQVRAGLQDEQSFAATIGHDPVRITPAADLLTALRGKDVLIVYVESYGRVAVQDSAISPQVDAMLDAGTAGLRAAGFSARSAFLTSPTFGGISWLAHSTLQSGLWIDNQQRYDQLVGSDRFTLSDAFKRAGWRTVGDVPSNYKTWPEGTSFYHYDQIYDGRNVGYLGPSFSYANMPDQYVMASFQRLELGAPHHVPVMAEIDLVSSHTPWAPLPRLVDWKQVGDGSAFDGMPSQGASPDLLWRHPDQVRVAYGQSIEYSMSTLVSFLQTYHDDNLVLVVLGDHQPATIVTGSGASHDVPISIIAHDPAVFDRISGWGWSDGLRPSPQAPVWPMDTFRNRFLAAYGP